MLVTIFFSNESFGKCAFIPYDSGGCWFRCFSPLDMKAFKHKLLSWNYNLRPPPGYLGLLWPLGESKWVSVLALTIDGAKEIGLLLESRDGK